MRVEHLPSRVLQKKFEEWFRDLIPADTDHSIEDPDPADFPFRTARYYPYYIYRSSRAETLPKLFELFIFGIVGAAFVGVGAGFIVWMMNMSNLEWSNSWPSQNVVICLAILIGFGGGIVGGSIDKLRERYSDKV